MRKNILNLEIEIRSSPKWPSEIVDFKFIGVRYEMRLLKNESFHLIYRHVLAFEQSLSSIVISHAIAYIAQHENRCQCSKTGENSSNEGE